MHPFSSSEKTKIGLSVAYSITHNPRRLENEWTAPWIDSGHKLCEEYPTLLFSTGIPLWTLPNQEAEMNNNLAVITAEIASEKAEVAKIAAELLEGQEERRSARIREQRETKIRDIEDRIDILNTERNDIMGQIELHRQRFNLSAHDQDTASDTSMDQESIHEAIPTKIPDFVIQYVQAAYLNEPDDGPEIQTYYDNRLGIRVHTRDHILFGELKSPPSRALEIIHPQAWEMENRTQLKRAKEQVVMYCYTSLKEDIEGNSAVIAIVASGACYQWAIITREQLGSLQSWDPTERKFTRSSDLLKSRNFFKGRTFRLGTVDSDGELERIKRAIPQLIKRFKTEGDIKQPTGVDWIPDGILHV